MASGGAASKAGKVLKAVAAKASKSAAAPKSATKPKAASPPAEPKPKRPSTTGLNATLVVSPACRKFFNQVEMSRTEATKQLWAYIKTHNLQDPEKKRIIVPDEKLRAFLGCKDRIDMTEIPGLLSPHFPKKSA